MSITHKQAKDTSPNTTLCSLCHSIIPADAAFCSTCGTRLETAEIVPSQIQSGISGRYRITALIRRRPCVLFFRAFDNHYQRPVTLCDIDMSMLDEQDRQQALSASIQLYDQLRRSQISGVMPVIDLRYFQGHLYIVASSPFPNQSPEAPTFPYTLQDLLQSGIGLPSEQTAVAWMHRLCNALHQLHQLTISIGDLDPNAIIVPDTTYTGQPALTVSWLPTPIRSLLPRTSTITNMTRFYAPESSQEIVDPTTDTYSIGAILYLLLTGTPPDEIGQRLQRPMRSPRELNPRISTRTDEIVMRALALENDQRFQSANELALALLDVIAPQSLPARQLTTTHEQMLPPDDPEEVTISIAPIQAQLARWYLAKRSSHLEPADTSQRTEPPTQTQVSTEDTPTTIVPLNTADDAPIPLEEEESDETTHRLLPPLPEPIARAITGSLDTPGELVEMPHEADHAPSLSIRFRKQLSGLLPAISTLRPPPSSAPTSDTTLLKRLQRFFLGEQRHSTTAAALIETPLRVQPGQGYVLRIHIMGRNEPERPPKGGKDAKPVGLSGMVQGEHLHIEIRSALYQNYAYIVQRADVQIPARGFAAEVVMPMQPLSNGSNGRHERLHIFFTDDVRQSLYEQPFVVEIFISRLVQAGREGHNVLSIPL